jgi:hypothetical protein
MLWYEYKRVTKCGNNFAVSSDGLATALQDSASALMSAGNNLEQSVALVAAANKVLQDPSQVGSALRTIALRIRGTSVEVLEEMGEETDGVIESVSKLQEKIKGLTGVDILTDSGAYKETYEIIKELAEVWPTLDDMDQAAALEMLAGKNRSNALAAILTNLEDLTGAYEDAMKAQGSAEAENEKYLDSIQGKIDQFNNALQTMWMNVISSDMIKGIVDFGTQIIQLIDKLGLLKTAILGILVVTTGKSLFKGLNFASLIKDISQVNNSMSVLNKGMTVAQAVSNTSELKNLTLGKSFITLGTNIGTATKALAKFLFTTPVGWAILAIGAITSVISVYNGLKQAESEAAESARQSAQALQETNNSLDSYKEKIQTLRDSLKGGNLSEEEAYNARKQLMSIQDELVAEYGDEARAINLVTGEVEDQIAAIDRLAVANAQEWLNKNNEKTGFLGLGKSAIDQATSAMEDTRNAVLDLNNDTWIQIFKDAYMTPGSGIEWLNQLQEAQSELAKYVQDELGGTYIEDSRAFKFENATKEEIANYYDQIIAWFNNYAAESGHKLDFGDLIGDISSQKTDILGKNFETHKANYEAYLENTAITQYNDAYGKILDAQEKFNEEYAKGNTEGAKVARTELETAINEAVAQAGEGSRQAKWFEGLDDDFVAIFKDMDFTDAWDAAGTQLKSLIERTLKDAGFDEDIDILGLKQYFDNVGNLIVDQNVAGLTGQQVAGYQALVAKAKEYEMSIDELIAKLSQLGAIQGSAFTGPASFDITNYTESIGAITDQISDYQSALDKLDSGSFTMSDYVELIEKFPDLAKGVKVTSKGFQGLTKSLKQAIKSAPDDLIESLEDLRDSLTSTDEIEEINALIDALKDLDNQTFTSLMDNLISLQNLLDEMSQKRFELNTVNNLDPNPLYKDALTTQRNILENFENGLTGMESVVWDQMRALYGDSTINKILADTGTSWAEKVQSAYEAALQYDRWFPQTDDAEGLYNAPNTFMNDIQAMIAANETAAQLLRDAGATWENGVLDLPNYLVSELAEALNIDPTIFEALVAQVAQYKGIILEDARDISHTIEEMLQEGSDNALANLEAAQSSISHLLAHYGKEINWDDVLDKKGLGGVLAELKTLLTEAKVDPNQITNLLDQYEKLYDMTKLPKDVQEAVDGISASAAKVQDVISKASTTNGENVFVDKDKLKSEAEAAKMATEDIEKLVEAISKTESVKFIEKTAEDPLGIKSLLDDIPTLEGYLTSLGIKFEEIKNEAGNTVLTINTDDLIRKLDEAGLDADQISQKLTDLANQEGIKLDLDDTALSPEKIQEKIDAIKSGTSTEGNDIELKVGADIVNASTELQNLQTQIDDLRNSTAENPISLDIDMGETSWNDLAKLAAGGLIDKLGLSSEEVNIVVNAALGDVISDLQSVNQELTKLQELAANNANIQMDVSGSAFELDRLQTVYNKFNNIFTRLQLIKRLSPMEVQVEVNYEDVLTAVVAIEDAVDRLQEKLSSLNMPELKLPTSEEGVQDQTVALHVDTSELANAQSILDSLASKYINVNVDLIPSNIISTLQALKGAIDALYSKTIYITTVYTTIGSPSSGGYGGMATRVNGSAHVQGIAHASGDWGLPRAEKKALVGELGMETVVDPNTGRYYTVGDTGAEFVDLPKGAIIFNHKQTEELFKNGYVAGRGKAVVNGSAHVAGTAYASGSWGAGWSSVGRNGHKTGKGSGSGGNEDDYEEIIDWFEILLEEINEQLDLMNAKLENAVGISAKKSLISQILSTNHYELGKLNEGLKLYTDYAAELLKDVPEQYREAVQNGAVDITEFLGEANKDTVEAINKYREWAQKIADVNQQLEEVKKTISDLRVEALDMINTEYENEIGLVTVVNDRIKDTIDLLEEKGERASANFYTEMIKNSEEQLKKLQEQRQAMQAEFDEAVASGDVEKYSENWYEMLNAIYEVDSAIIECKTDIEEFDNAILDLHWENFEKIIDALDAISDESEQIRSVIRDNEIVDEAGNWTKDGITALAMAAQEMEKARYRADLYGEQIEELNKQFAAGKYSQDEYREKLQELKEGQWDSIEAYESAKDAIVDLNKTRIEAVKDGIQKEIDAYEELINKRKEDLDAQKDAHDWANTLKDHTDEIDKIQRQIDAMSGDTSAAAVARRKQLEEELANAQTELDETYYDRNIEQQQQALDDSLEAYQKDKEARIEELEKYLEKEDQVISDSYALILANTESVAATLQEISERYGITISKNITDPWENGANALGKYTEELDYSTSAYVDMLERVRKELIDIQLQADKTAASLVDSIQSSTKNTQNNTTKSTPAKQQSAPAPSLAVGAQVTVKGSATHFARDGGNGTKMQSWVPGSTFTVYQTAGDQVLLGIPGKGYTGWVRKQDLVGYAKGTTGVKNDQLAWIDENGLEELVMHADGGKLAYLSKGSAVIPGDLTDNIMKWGTIDPTTMLERNRPSIGAPHMIENQMQIDMSIAEVVHIDHADHDSIPEIQDAVKKQLDSYMKNLNSRVKGYAR